MKVKSGMTDVVGFPLCETDRIMDAMKQAEQAGDLPALKWCARFLLWLWDEGDVMGTDSYCYAEGLFNKLWSELLKNDAPPESIAAIINRADEPEPITAKAAEKALDTVKEFFEKSMGGKGYRAALEKLDALRAVLETAEAGQ